MIESNKLFLTGKEAGYMREAVLSRKVSGNGIFTKKRQSFFEETYGIKKVLLTASCTDALERCLMLCGIEPGNEVIIPSYTFVSTALDCVKAGVKIAFADSYSSNPNIDPYRIEELIIKKTKAIVPLHYARIAWNMDRLMKIAGERGLLGVNDIGLIHRSEILVVGMIKQLYNA